MTKKYDKFLLWHFTIIASLFGWARSLPECTYWFYSIWQPTVVYKQHKTEQNNFLWQNESCQHNFQWLSTNQMLLCGWLVHFSFYASDSWRQHTPPLKRWKINPTRKVTFFWTDSLDRLKILVDQMMSMMLFFLHFVGNLRSTLMHQLSNYKVILKKIIVFFLDLSLLEWRYGKISFFLCFFCIHVSVQRL